MNNFLDPAILFFVFGVLAGALKSNLEIPRSIAKFLSLYLLMALGLKGGFSLAKSGFTPDVLVALSAAIIMAFLVPALGYQLLKNRVNRFDAAAVAAAYGSVSAVTFVTAMQYMDKVGLTFGGYMPVAMVVMESPAIIMAVLLSSTLRHAQTAPAAAYGANVSASVSIGAGGVAVMGGGFPGAADVGGGSGDKGIGSGLVASGNSDAKQVPTIGKILHESFTDGAHLLLLGAMAVGYISGDAGKAVMQPFSGDLFKGMLAFFLLDMGLMVARNFSEARKASPVLILYALVSPFAHAALALGLSLVLGLPVGDAALLMVLSASASYIVVPAVLRYAIPEANPAIYFGLSLTITFPLNILFGIPLYTAVAQHVLN